MHLIVYCGGINWSWYAHIDTCAIPNTAKLVSYWRLHKREELDHPISDCWGRLIEDENRNVVAVEFEDTFRFDIINSKHVFDYDPEPDNSPKRAY